MNYRVNQTLKLYFIFILFLGWSVNLFSQNQNIKSDFWNNVSFGGAIALNFGNNIFSGTLAPSAIYNFNPYVSAGLGLSGTYNTQKDVFSSTILGGSIIGLFNPINEIQLSTEFEQLNVNREFENGLFPDSEENFWANALFLGAGYRSGPVTIGIRYDVLYDERDSIYADPWIPFVRVFF